MKFIPVNTPLLEGNEKKYLNECIDTGWISSEGPFIGEFENKFASRVQRKHGIAVANGSAALDIAVKALDLEPGDEVIIPSFTIISCAASVIRQGATPIFVDANPRSWNSTVEHYEKALSARTKAIMLVHIYGLPVDMEPILDLAKKHGIKVIEDAAEMHGQTYLGKPCGSFGDISTFSFYPNKHITTGEGGMIVCNNDSLAERCRSLRNLCFKAEQRFVHDEIGWNYRMTNMQAALGLAQLEQLDHFVEKKRNMGKIYQENLANISGIQLPLAETDYAQNIYWVFGIVLDESLGIDAIHIMNQCNERGIGTRPFFWPMHKQPIFEKMGLCLPKSLPVSEKLGRFGFYIPSGLALSVEEIEHICNTIQKIFKK